MAGSLTVVPALTTRPSINLTSTSMVGAAEIKDIKLNCVQHCKVNVYIFIILIIMIITQFFLTLYWYSCVWPAQSCNILSSYTEFVYLSMGQTSDHTFWYRDSLEVGPVLCPIFLIVNYKSSDLRTTITVWIIPSKRYLGLVYIYMMKVLWWSRWI